MIFVDSSFWIALSSGRDGWREQAVALLAQLGSERLVTSNHVRGESWTFVNRRYGHRAAVGMLDRLQSGVRLQLEHVSPRLEEEALQWLRTRAEREYSFVDATSFALMRSLRIREAFAFDGDFTAAGFVELRAAAR